MIRMLIDGEPGERVAASDRGLAYGDGVFETIRFVGGRAPLWPRHMQRLLAGCARLRLPPPLPARLADEAAAVVAGLAQAVVRITVTRGSGPRGYAPPAEARPTRIVAAFEAPAAAGGQGIRVRLCRTRWAAQPLLAGIKHLNRLEQVLARAEWEDPAIAEGLVLDAEGQVISATAANVFAVLDGAPCTPPLDRCGVEGVARAEVLAALPRARVCPLSLGALAEASELFLSSSVRGILPVIEFEQRSYPAGPVGRALQAHWLRLGFS